MDQTFRRIRRGRLGTLSPRDVDAINRGLAAVEEHDRFSASGLVTRRSRTGLVFTDVTRRGFWARITGAAVGSPPAHPWEEVYESEPGIWEALDPQAPGTTTDNPAYDVAGGEAPAGSIVWLEPQDGSEPPFWLFEAPGTVTLTDAVTVPPDSTWVLGGDLVFSGVGPLIINVPLIITDTWEWAHYPCLTPYDLIFTLTSYDSTDLTLTAEPWWRLLLDAGGDVYWTGLPAPADGCGADLWLTVLEDSDGDLVLEHEQLGSPASDQFLTPGTDPWLTGPGESTHLRYDPITERWRVMHRPAGAPVATDDYQVLWSGSGGAPFDATWTQTPEVRSLVLSHADGGAITLSPPSGTADRTFTWPADLPAAGEFLSVNGVVGSTATLEWAAAGGGGSEGVLAATGTTQGDAATIVTDMVTVTGADGNKGVILPDVVGARVVVWNDSPSAGFTLRVYPHVGAQINTLGVNNPMFQGQQVIREFCHFSPTQWRTL